jgi:hypothetical protein
MEVSDVHELVRQGQVVKHPRYHAGKRGIGFGQILLALERCYAVRPDLRQAEGTRIHANGWYALANLPNRRRLRVDFDLQEDEAGRLLLVVTAYDT